MFLLLFALFILLPIAELYVIIQVGGAIGLLPTLALLIADSLIGAALWRSQGRRAWERFNTALANNKIPARETFDGAMIILGGALLLTPGFITDIFGLILLIPPSRALVRGFVTKFGAKRFGVGWVVTGMNARRGAAPNGPGPGPGAPGPTGPPPGRGPRRAYDVEGTATEVGDAQGELDAGNGHG